MASLGNKVVGKYIHVIIPLFITFITDIGIKLSTPDVVN